MVVVAVEEAHGLCGCPRGGTGTCDGGGQRRPCEQALAGSAGVLGGTVRGRRDGGGPRLRFGAGLVRRKGVRGCLTPSPSDTAGSRQALEEGALAGVFDEDESSPARRRGESLVRVADGRAAGLVRAGFEFVLPGPLSLFFELYRW